ncbi:MAG: heme-binding protein [Flavobacterium sp.]|nr:MAG: heme-binding protein [Flavobacterium sp.]
MYNCPGNFTGKLNYELQACFNCPDFLDCIPAGKYRGKICIETRKHLLRTILSITQNAAFELMARASQKAEDLNKTVSIAILDNAGNIMLLAKGNGVGPHNTEAARRKAYTALSTKTSTLELLRNADCSKDTKNLNTLPELLLLSRGLPIFYKGVVVGSIGVAGGGSPENDEAIAKSCSITEYGITTP